MNEPKGDHLENRIEAHNRGKGAKYTCGRIPAVLAYKEICNSKSDALKRELALNISKIFKAVFDEWRLL